MRALIALIRREYLEHRGAFLYAPLGLVGLFAAFIAVAVVSHRVDFILHLAFGAPVKLYETLYLGLGALWWAYLGMTLFFYAADGFNADTRNNALLFWKSMPQSDFKILLSKLFAGLTCFPLLVFMAALLSGIVLAFALELLPQMVPGIVVPGPAELAGGWVKVSAIMASYLVVALLWYVPFFAWVGALSTIVGRWSIPLGLLLPVIVSLFEGAIDFGAAPGGSYVFSYLRWRLSFNYDTAALQAAFLSPLPLDVRQVVGDMLAGVDWLSVGGGVVFAIVVVYLASQYRRRVIKG